MNPSAGLWCYGGHCRYADAQYPKPRLHLHESQTPPHHTRGQGYREGARHDSCPKLGEIMWLGQRIGKGSGSQALTLKVHKAQ
jgi:hypothetical protein